MEIDPYKLMDIAEKPAFAVMWKYVSQKYPDQVDKGVWCLEVPIEIQELYLVQGAGKVKVNKLADSLRYLDIPVK